MWWYLTVRRACLRSPRALRRGGATGEAVMTKERGHGAERLFAAPAHFCGGGGSGHPGGGASDLPDIVEDDVWPAFHAAADEDERDPGRQRGRSRRLDDQHVSGLSLALEDACWGPVASQLLSRGRHRVSSSSSAPVDVPAWSRSLRSGSEGPLPDREEGEEVDEGWLPPHEYLARAQGKSMATSVFEGVGRTLKGRDMSRLRDTVWSQTGFFG
ncbi:hypothetical protein MUK42_27986 [Musa troglodytarum]|uniref:Senescence regulator n=3 Tax=Musa troglodytarum TaxID=320322 RepID=A0A9E7JM33_9LILI|nr:hypothetical protein MUK42_27986 [Musa troglodytarum]